MSVCTFVEGPGGKRWFQLLADVDSPGVYALVMSQGTYHGNGCPKEDVSLRLPICLGLASYTDRELRSFAACQFRDSAGMVARVGGENLRKHICNLWREDLQNIGGLPKGLPNSEKLGIQRSSGLGFGQASVAVRRCEGVRRLWDAAAVAVGRPPVFAGDYASAPCCTSFDGVLYTTTEHAYQGLARHVDTFPFETGQLQCFVVVWPPPSADVRRLGCALAYYKPNKELWRRMAYAMVTRRSTSPDLDSRTHPEPTLGSSAKPRGGWPVLGGPRLSKKEADECTPDELAGHVKRLDSYLRCTLPAMPTDESPTHIDFLRSCGYTPLSGLALQRARRKTKEHNLRKLFLRALAGGLQPGKASSRKLFSSGTLYNAPLLVDRCILYNAPEKLDIWCRAGGRHKRRQGVVLQPSGSLGAKEKAVGNLAASGKRRKL
jgi:hypothetical protein